MKKFYTTFNTDFDTDFPIVLKLCKKFGSPTI